jgi:hypothetical protein
MSELVVLVFKGDKDRASAAYKELEPMAKHGQIAVDGARSPSRIRAARSGCARHRTGQRKREYSGVVSGVC